MMRRMSGGSSLRLSKTEAAAIAARRGVPDPDLEDHSFKYALLCCGQ